MKRLLAAFLLAGSAQAATFSLDLGKLAHAIKARHDSVPTSVRLRRGTAALAGLMTVGDFVSTNQKIAQGFCELNPGLQAADGCHVNVARFTALKIGMLLWLGPGEELAHKLPHGRIWDRENIVLNIGAAATFAALTIHNEAQK